MRGLITNKQFNRFFDWFYPNYMSAIVESSLNAFYDDDVVVHVCFKVWIETVQNRNNRLRFDTWSINGLIVFKETGKYISKLLQVWDSMRTKPTTGDLYISKYKFVLEISQWFVNVVSGNYINFAICEYYQDETFSELITLILSMYCSLDLQ